MCSCSLSLTTTKAVLSVFLGSFVFCVLTFKKKTNNKKKKQGIFWRENGSAAGDCCTVVSTTTTTTTRTARTWKVTKTKRNTRLEICWKRLTSILICPPNRKNKEEAEGEIKSGRQEKIIKNRSVPLTKPLATPFGCEREKVLGLHEK